MLLVEMSVQSNHLDWCICVLECQVWSSVMGISRSLAGIAGSAFILRWTLSRYDCPHTPYHIPLFRSDRPEGWKQSFLSHPVEELVYEDNRSPLSFELRQASAVISLNRKHGFHLCYTLQWHHNDRMRFSHRELQPILRGTSPPLPFPIFPSFLILSSLAISPGC
jgi:hypothetical protein